MKASRIAGALAFVLVAGGARAESFIPGNNVDDFGPFTYSSSPAPDERTLVASRSPIVLSNNVDDFGPFEYKPAAESEEFGAAGGEPGMVARAAERAQEKAALEAYNREKFLRTIYSPLP